MQRREWEMAYRDGAANWHNPGTRIDHFSRGYPHIPGPSHLQGSVESA